MSEGRRPRPVRPAPPRSARPAGESGNGAPRERRSRPDPVAPPSPAAAPNRVASPGPAAGGPSQVLEVRFKGLRSDFFTFSGVPR